METLKNKTTPEIDKLKYWLDTEFTLLHIMFAVIMLQLTRGFWPTLWFGIYLGFSVIYFFSRAAHLASLDKDYLKIKK